VDTVYTDVIEMQSAPQYSMERMERLGLGRIGERVPDDKRTDTVLSRVSPVTTNKIIPLEERSDIRTLRQLKLQEWKAQQDAQDQLRTHRRQDLAKANDDNKMQLLNMVQSTQLGRVLAGLGLPTIDVHPGYQLRVQTLGAFRAWRGDVEIAPREWQRDRARQLFQLLLTYRARWLQRDEIADRLWPNLAPEAAARDFKVALNALNKAIEPNRSGDGTFAFVIREGAAYRLRPEADVWLDAIEFERASEAGLRTGDLGQLRSALRLYRGDYLPDALYDDWASEERERLLSLYLRAADKLAGLLIERGDYDEALDICQAILARDACWERAYRLTMTAHAKQGNRPLALRAYQRCVATLRDELGVEPSAATTTLYRQITQSDEPPATAS